MFASRSKRAIAPSLPSSPRATTLRATEDGLAVLVELGPVDGAHGAAADLAVDLERADVLADQHGGGSPRVVCGNCTSPDAVGTANVRCRADRFGP